MVDPVKPWPLVAYAIPNAGKSVVAAYGPLVTGIINNPLSTQDQNCVPTENLYVDFTAPATLFATNTTFAIIPGESIIIPENFSGQVWVNALTAGHRFAGVVFQPPSTRISQKDAAPPGLIPFPPETYTTLLETIPSYLYQQYSDDDDLQAFVAAYNILAQQYVDWFVQVSLPYYPGLQGQLLDWVGSGLYGLARAPIPYGRNKNVGPLNTWAMNTIPLNVNRIIYPNTFYLTTDDIYQRILTWHFFKGDGKIFNIRWLKRRIMRFLEGTNGGPGPDGVLGPADSSSISVSFGGPYQINISLGWFHRNISSGAIFNTFAMNTRRFNEIHLGPIVSFVNLSPYAPIFKAAADAGLLELPFQFKFNITVVELR